MLACACISKEYVSIRGKKEKRGGEEGGDRCGFCDDIFLLLKQVVMALLCSASLWSDFAGYCLQMCPTIHIISS